MWCSYILLITLFHSVFLQYIGDVSNVNPVEIAKQLTEVSEAAVLKIMNIRFYRHWIEILRAKMNMKRPSDKESTHQYFKCEYARLRNFYVPELMINFAKLVTSVEERLNVTILKSFELQECFKKRSMHYLDLSFKAESDQCYVPSYFTEEEKLNVSSSLEQERIYFNNINLDSFMFKILSEIFQKSAARKCQQLSIFVKINVSSQNIV
ncbi:unnamed protein product, partial [Schistosoma turkestanicum]